MRLIKFHFVVLLAVLCTYGGAQQNIGDQIDALFDGWNSTHVPGGSVGVIRNGSVVYEKAFGMASLEYNVTNTTETIFNLASVSKQFTAFGILLLEQQGLLSIDDEIQKYLPEIPYFDHRVTIRHMLHHTSGLRSLHALLSLAGWRGDDRRSNADLMLYMSRQKDLNFEPGDDYLYCNTGYIFMAEIIERVTGDVFEDWMKENVFAPLGMKSSFCRRDINLVIPNVATSYSGPTRGVFEKSIEYWAYVGSGNMHSTIGDLMNWLDNFRTAKLGGRELIERMQTKFVLKDGNPINYAFGVNVDNYKGLKRISHGGSIGGYRAHIVYFPEQETGIVVLTNFSSSGPAARAMQVADIILKEYIPEMTSEIGQNPVFTDVDVPRAELEKMPGNYMTEDGAYRRIFLEEGKLYLIANQRIELGPLGNGRFYAKGMNRPMMIEIAHEENGKANALNLVDEDEQEQTWTSYEKWEPELSDINELTGSYYSPELEITYKIVSKEGQLQFYHPRLGERSLTTYEKDMLRSGNIQIKLMRDERNKIEGIRISNGRVRNLWMEKITKN